jgi:hypothetical protein
MIHINIILNRHKNHQIKTKNSQDYAKSKQKIYFNNIIVKKLNSVLYTVLCWKGQIVINMLTVHLICSVKQTTSLS